MCLINIQYMTMIFKFILGVWEFLQGSALQKLPNLC